MPLVSDKTKEISRILLILIRINIISSFKVWFSAFRGRPCLSHKLDGQQY